MLAILHAARAVSESATMRSHNTDTSTCPPLQVHSELSGDIVVEDVERSADDGSGGTQVRDHSATLATLVLPQCCGCTCSWILHWQSNNNTRRQERLQEL